MESDTNQPLYFNENSEPVQRRLRGLNSWWKFPFFLFFRLPAAFFMGIRIKNVTPYESNVTLPFTWFTKNPFRSVYFAAECAAAELSTGLLAMTALQGQGRISMLIVNMDATFLKKATSKITFTCEEGDKIIQAVDEAIKTGEGRAVTVTSVGRMKDGVEVAKVDITWSFKKK